MENYTIILYKSYYICYSPTDLNRLCRSTKTKETKHQYYQAIDKTFKKTTVITHVHPHEITHKCKEGKQYPVTQIPC